ncbi:MAG: hypothetical protein WAV46_00735 [Candidatus Moraniibacteriota bacterium]
MNINIGFDLSRVIIAGQVKRQPDFVSNGNVFLPRAVDTLLAITGRYGADHIFIVSHAKSQDEEDRIREWCGRHGFYARTGILAQNVLLCRERLEKRTFCERFHFDVLVDDRLEILGQIADVVPQLFLFQGRKKEIQKRKNQPYRTLLDKRITRVNSWGDLGKCLLC